MTPPSTMQSRCVRPESGYHCLLENVAEFWMSVDHLDEQIVSALLDWRLRWLRSNPFA